MGRISTLTIRYNLARLKTPMAALHRLAIRFFRHCWRRVQEDPDAACSVHDFLSMAIMRT